MEGIWGAGSCSPPRSHPALPAQPVPPAPYWAAFTIPPPLLPWEVFYPNLFLEYLVFLIFPFSQTCSCLSCSHVPGEEVASFPSGAVLSVRQWLCLSLFLTQGIPHLPHSPSPWLLSPFCFVPHVLGSLCPSVAVLLLSYCSLLSPGQLGVVAVPSPTLACSIKP